MKYEITALPHAGFDAYRRGNKTFTSSPMTITVKAAFEGLTKDMTEDQAEAERVKQLGDGEVTPAQFEAISTDSRLRVSQAHASKAHAPAAAHGKKSDEK